MDTYVLALSKLIIALLKLLRRVWARGKSRRTAEEIQEVVQSTMMVGWAHACRFLQSESKRLKQGEHTYLPAPPVYTVSQAERLLEQNVGDRHLTKEVERNIERTLTRMVRKSTNSTIVRASSDDPHFHYVDMRDQEQVVEAREKMVSDVLAGKQVSPFDDPTRQPTPENRKRQETVRKRRETDAEYRKRVRQIIRERIAREEAEEQARERAEREAKEQRIAQLKAERKPLWDGERPLPLSASEVEKLRKWQAGGDHSKAIGYARVITGEWTCGFCVMIASRGPVYKSAEKAGLRKREDGTLYNSFHYNCDCIVVPVFGHARNYPGAELSDYYYALYRKWYEDEYTFGINRGDEKTRDPKYVAWRRARGLPADDDSIRDLTHYLEYLGFQGAYQRPKRARKTSVRTA